MTAAHPLLPMDDLDVIVDDDLSAYSPEGQAAIRAAEERIAGGTAVLVPHSEIEAIVERQRRLAMKAG